jgi:hypothetical protein
VTQHAVTAAEAVGSAVTRAKDAVHR